MTNRAQDAYLSQKVLSADPVELVRMLYAAALESVQAARARLAAQDIRGRSARICRAVDILSELAGALDHNRAPDLSRNLAALYDYMQRRLLEANFQQADAPLAEVLGLLRTLAEAWQLAPPAATSAAPARGWNPLASEFEPAAAVQGWSF